MVYYLCDATIYDRHPNRLNSIPRTWEMGDARRLRGDGELYICDLEDEVYKAVKESNEEQLLELLEGGANPNSWVRGSRRAKRPPTWIELQRWIQGEKGRYSWTRRFGSSEEEPIATPILTYAVSLVQSDASHKCVEYLLEYGADPYAQVLGNCPGATAMAMALNSVTPGRNWEDVADWEDVALLLNATGKVSCTKEELVQIANASDQSQVSPISQLILELRIGKPMTNERKTHELMRSVLNHDTDVLSLMLQAGADPNLLQIFGIGEGLPLLASSFLRESSRWKDNWGLDSTCLLSYGADPYAQFKVEEDLCPYRGGPTIKAQNTCTIMGLFVECEHMPYIAALLNFCDPFRRKERWQYMDDDYWEYTGTYSTYRERLAKDPLFNDLLVGRETQAPKSAQIRESTWLSALPVQSHTNAELKKRERKYRFKV